MSKFRVFPVVGRQLWGARCLPFIIIIIHTLILLSVGIRTMHHRFQWARGGNRMAFSGAGHRSCYSLDVLLSCSVFPSYLFLFFFFTRCYHRRVGAAGYLEDARPTCSILSLLFSPASPPSLAISPGYKHGTHLEGLLISLSLCCHGLLSVSLKPSPPPPPPTASKFSLLFVLPLAVSSIHPPQVALCFLPSRNPTPYPIVNLILYSIVHRKIALCLRFVLCEHPTAMEARL